MQSCCCKIRISPAKNFAARLLKTDFVCFSIHLHHFKLLNSSEYVSIFPLFNKFHFEQFALGYKESCQNWVTNILLSKVKFFDIRIWSYKSWQLNNLSQSGIRRTAISNEKSSITKFARNEEVENRNNCRPQEGSFLKVLDPFWRIFWPFCGPGAQLVRTQSFNGKSSKTSCAIYSKDVKWKTSTSEVLNKTLAKRPVKAKANPGEIWEDFTSDLAILKTATPSCCFLHGHVIFFVMSEVIKPGGGSRHFCAVSTKNTGAIGFGRQDKKVHFLPSTIGYGTAKNANQKVIK